jgi:hypothetical protein
VALATLPGLGKVSHDEFAQPLPWSEAIQAVPSWWRDIHSQAETSIAYE